MRLWDRWAEWAEKCFDHSVVRQLYYQRLALFLTVCPQLVCDGVAIRTVNIEGTRIIPGYLAQLAFLRSLCQMAIGSFYSLCDQ